MGWLMGAQNAIPELATAPDSCKFHTCYDYIEASGRVAQLTGVLTALTFTAIIFLASREEAERKQDEQTLVTFIAAFISLAVSTYIYDAAASEERVGGRGAFVNFAASLVFAIAIQQVLLGLTRLVAQRSFSRAASFATEISAEIFALIVFGFLAITAIDGAGQQKSQHDAFVSPVGVTSAVLFVALVIHAYVTSKRSVPDRLQAGSSEEAVRRFAF
jgi:hypothetical protein